MSKEDIFIVLDTDTGETRAYTRNTISEAEKAARNLVESGSLRVRIYAGKLLGVCSADITVKWEKPS